MELDIQQLKEIATKLKINHSPNIGEVKLKEKIEAECAELNITLEEVVEGMNFNSKPESAEDLLDEQIKSNSIVDQLKNLTFATTEAENAKKTEIVENREAMKLIRCIITCNNRNKTSYQGEIFSARNAKLPEIKKMIPFGVITHVPQILLNVIKEKEYQMFRKEKINGRTTNKTYLVPEYNIQILPPITKDELEAIRKKQLAEGFTGE